jgi:hypothetical protein
LTNVIARPVQSSIIHMQFIKPPEVRLQAVQEIIKVPARGL